MPFIQITRDDFRNKALGYEIISTFLQDRRRILSSRLWCWTRCCRQRACLGSSRTVLLRWCLHVSSIGQAGMALVGVGTCRAVSEVWGRLVKVFVETGCEMCIGSPAISLQRLNNSPEVADFFSPGEALSSCYLSRAQPVTLGTHSSEIPSRSSSRRFAWRFGGSMSSKMHWTPAALQRLQGAWA